MLLTMNKLLRQCVIRKGEIKRERTVGRHAVAIRDLHLENEQTAVRLQHHHRLQHTHNIPL